ncbi:MAG: tRNA-uridine aminocarboxypropyltransferase [Polyangiaceae bacterium]
MTEVLAPVGRAYCYRCMKPRITCLCARILRVDNRTTVWLLQHPRERFHPIGTARILELGLARFASSIAFHAQRPASSPALAGRAALLYPSADARDLSELAVDERPDVLVVLDGTWHHTHALARDFEFLGRLPRVKLPAGPASRYRIRKEPRHECVSTVEAVVRALALLEPETPGLEGLLEAFEALIDDQLRYVRARAGPRRMKLRKDGPRALPRALGAHFDRAVVLYAEARPESAPPHGLLQLVAQRVADGALFDEVLRGEPPRGLLHMRLSAEDFIDGMALAELGAAFAAFLPERAELLAWNQSTLDALRKSGLATGGTSLKGVWAERIERAPGTLEAALARRGASVAPLAVRGRAAERLAQARTAAELLRASR